MPDISKVINRIPTMNDEQLLSLFSWRRWHLGRTATELVSFADEEDRVVAHLRGPDGHEERAEANYIAGCDGARSTVRETLGTGFQPDTYVALADGSGAPSDLDPPINVSSRC